ncbi:tyrosine-type recombinase/integrase [Ottowia thiooxydans]|uniref:Integrase n=1 Tax=Ottowia thiooxydans TaxID=219182 RepID=A0ABV2QA36_9BURK
MEHESLIRCSDVKVGVTRYLFVNKSTQRSFVTITRAWYRLRAKAGIEGRRIHDLRHSFASFLVNGGRSLYEVQQILGHLRYRP